MKKSNNRNNNSAAITSIKNEEFDALIEARYGLKKEDLERISKSKKEQKCWSKPTPIVEKEEKVGTTTTTRRGVLSNGDKGFVAGVLVTGATWLLSKLGEKTQPKQQPLTAEEEYDIVERRMMRDAYLRHISRQ